MTAPFRIALDGLQCDVLPHPGELPGQRRRRGLTHDYSYRNAIAGCTITDTSHNSSSTIAGVVLQSGTTSTPWVTLSGCVIGNNYGGDVHRVSNTTAPSGILLLGWHLLWEQRPRRRPDRRGLYRESDLWADAGLGHH